MTNATQMPQKNKVELALENHRNHIHIIYETGQLFEMRNVSSVIHDEEKQSIVVTTLVSSGSTRQIDHGIYESSSTVTKIETAIDIGLLGGIVVTSTRDEYQNRKQITTVLNFSRRGVLVGGIVPVHHGW